MTSSSSLYGTVTQQNTSSSNSTSLYGEAGTPIPDSSGNVVVRGDLYVLSGNILTTATTGNIFPANATTINLGLAATAVNIGAGTGTTTINNDLSVDGTITAPGADFGNIQIAVLDDQTISTTAGELRLTSTSGAIKLPSVTSIYTDTTGSFGLLNQPTTVNAFIAATAINIGADTGTTNINNDLLVEGTGTFTGDISAPGGTIGNIRVGVTNNNTIDTTTGALQLSSNAGEIGIIGADTLYTDQTTFNLLNAPTSVFAFRNATNLVMGEDLTGETTIANDLQINGDQVTLAQATNIIYSEANNRLNRPTVQSTTGNSSGFRVAAPNATTSAIAGMSVFGTNDPLNGKFINTQARGSTTDPLRVVLGQYTSGVIGTVGGKLAYYDNTTPFAYINTAGPTDPLDLTTKTYVDAQIGTIPAYDTNVVPITGGAELDLRQVDLGYTIVGSTKFLGGTNITVSETAPNEITIDGTDLNTTYTVDASTTTGGANFNLAGSDASVDTIKFANGSNVTVTATDANTITIAATDTNTTYTQDVSSTTGGANVNLNGSDASVDSVAYKGAGSVTVTATDASTVTITGTDTNTTYTVDATTTTGGANLNLTGSDASVDSVAYLGSGATTVSRTDANTITVSSTDTNTTYTIDASSTTGGANLNLVGSDASTDTVKIASGTGVTVSQTNANELSVAIGQSVATTADVVFNTVDANITTGNYILGQSIITQNSSYVPPGSALTTVTGSNGIVVSSSTGGANGYSPQVAVRYHTGDTTAAGNTAASLAFSAATGTSSSPNGGFSANLVLGTINWDGYTSGTSNNYATQIATTNQGAGTSAIAPIQAQAYARQTFTNSTTVTTAVTGASGTGSVATLTFTTQNTAPYVVGQTVTIAGMTPSGYNGTVVLTAATTSSISYANATTGFTSGGTIAAANTVTAAGAGFRVRGYANSINLTAANRFNFMDLTASTATFKSAAYTFANDVITGSTLTATNYMTLAATTGSINQDTFTLKNTAGTTTYATLNSTSATLNGDTVNLRNTAGTTTYGNFTSTGTTITGAGLSTVTRTTATETPGTAMSRPSMNIQLTRSDQAAANDGDNTSFRTRVAGSNGTFYTISDIGSVYKTGGDNEFRVNLANGDQTTGSFSGLSILSCKISETRIKAGTPSGTPGASTVSDIAIFAPTKITATVPVKFPAYTATAANAITGEIGMQICISDSAQGSNPNGMMAFWDTTNSRWSYIHDNSAV